MSDDQVWNDQSRNALRERLQSLILGELRLAKRGYEDILVTCQETYIQEECPKLEWATFVRFAADELNRAAAQIASESAAWPDETDCDRLDRVEIILRDRGILLWQVSPCCDNCTGSELPDRIDAINVRYPGFHDRVRGYAFFIDQNLPDMLAESTHVSVYLAYGWFPPQDIEVASEVYASKALDIAREVCKCLREQGFEIDWDGDLRRKIRVSLNWQRRTVIE